MGVILQKGGNIVLQNDGTILNDIVIGMGWRLKNSSSLELDATAFMLGVC